MLFQLRFVLGRSGRSISLALCAASLAATSVTGCAVEPPRHFVGPDPADASAGVRPIRYTSTLGAYVRQRPAAPRSWEQQNEDVAPRSGE